MRLSNLKDWARNENGSATVEAMLVFPLIIALILIMLLVAVYGYQQVYVQYITLTSAERASYSWDGRERSFRTAQSTSQSYYGLYEHELSALLLKSLISLPSSSKQKEVPVARDAAAIEPAGKFVDDRLAQAQSYIVQTKSGVQGRVALTHQTFIPTITVQLEKDISPLYWQQQALLPPPSYASQYDIHAPTQFIRSIDLFLYYVDKFSSLSNEQKQAWKTKGGKAVKSFSS